MSQQIVVFRAVIADASAIATHQRMVDAMRDLARQIDGFVEWRDAMDGLTYWGHVMFESESAALAWNGDPRHEAIHDHGDLVYTEFSTHAFASVRKASWRRSDRDDDDTAGGP